MYLDTKEHTKLTGNNPAKISAKEGAKFSAHGGYCFGKNLQLTKNKLIVQSWREIEWTQNEIDSTFVLSFEQKAKDVLLTMVHANIPERRVSDINSGWKDYYWKPWKKYLAEKL